MHDSHTDIFEKRIISIDFEFRDDDHPPYMVGVFSPDAENMQSWPINEHNESKVLELIDKICSHKEILLGHNVIAHDLRLLQEFYPYLNLLNKPVIDTLLLSPLAFPRWPYHRLVKDYKLVSYARNRPDEDAKLSWTLFRDEVTNLVDKVRVPDELFQAYAAWFIEDDEKGGFQRLYERLAQVRGHGLQTGLSLLPRLKSSLRDKACSTAFESVFSGKSISPKAKAFALSWIYGADEYSILSRWVRLQYDQVPEILDCVRNADCGQPNCAYCRSTFDLNSHLQRYFGHPSLRTGQQEVVKRMLQGENLLAILPTGGGKSLCYQLPALINAERRKTLTIVISPLQALMKDQIDGLKSKQIINAGAIYSDLTVQERKEVLDGVETGKIDLVYIAPEQLRNKNFISRIEQREIGAWVIDEAHCVSKWGHDFRPDYLYIPKIIRKLAERSKTPLPQVACFTATAKKDVILEIQDIFRQRLGISLALMDYGHERKELTYSTEAVSENAKLDKLIQILADEPGDAIVYVATKNGAKRVSDSLNNAPELKESGKRAAFYHSEVEPEEKKSIQDRFIQPDGDLNVIVATNAFGMGVDKPNVRLVVHYDIPGSLENYLQEAGRAGRDEAYARCVLLYSPGDIEKQFELKTMNRITPKDASEIRRGIESIDKKTRNTGDVTVTAGEILMEEGVDTDFEIGEHNTETKVKTALAILEESGLLSREENDYNVIQLVRASLNLAEVREKLDSWDLSDRYKQHYETIYQCLLESREDELINVDRLSHTAGIPIKNVMAIIRDLNAHGIIKITTNLVVYLNKGVRGDARNKLHQLLEQQSRLFELMQEKSEKWDQDETWPFDVRVATTTLQERWPELTPDRVTELVSNFRRLNIIDFKRANKDRFKVKIKASLDRARQLFAQSDMVCTSLINHVYRVLDSSHSQESGTGNEQPEIMPIGPAEQAKESHLRAEFTLEDLDESLKPNLADKSLEERIELVNKSLLFLNANEVLRLGRGLAVLKTAMRILLPKDGKRRPIQFDTLLEYYREQIFQVHVIEAYAEKSVKAIVQALDFVADYFKLDRMDFRRKHFLEQTDEELERPTSKADYQRIVKELNNPTQQEIVETNKPSLLIVAGPGSGKTRAIVHRAAYLLKVERIKPTSILIVAFNREAVNEIKNRLRELVGGHSAAFVDIYTYHGIAMRLAGKAFTPAVRMSCPDGQSEGGPRDFFDKVLLESVRILEQTDGEDSEDWEERRRRLLRGYSHILVDEYQDVDQPCYRLISAIAGRTLEDESKLNIVAVGDDDQNIYSWKMPPSDVRFIREFQQDYQAELVYLVENYRSTKAIIGASNRLISNNAGRIKSHGGQEVRINVSRQDDPVGGKWDTIDSSGDRGLVTVLEVGDAHDQGGAIVEEIHRRRMLDAEMDFSDIAILTRSHGDADFIIEGFKRLVPPVPTRSPSPAAIPFPMYREVAQTIDLLEASEAEIDVARDIERITLESLGHKSEHAWQYTVLAELLTDFVEFNGRAAVSVSEWVQYLWDYAATQKGQIPDLNAVLVTTIHQAKGKEFKQVFLLDPIDSARSDKPGQSVEDERRLYYVGLTRAKELACVMKVAGSKSPFADEILGAKAFSKLRPGNVHAQWPSISRSLPSGVKVIQMGLSDIWASSFAREQSTWFERDKVQAILSGISVGTPLTLRRSDFTPKGSTSYTVEILCDGLRMGSLSKATGSRYQEIDAIKVEVGAVIRCSRDDEDKYATLDKYYAVLPRVISAR